jgi:hypothetical protein
MEELTHSASRAVMTKAGSSCIRSFLLRTVEIEKNS